MKPVKVKAIPDLDEQPTPDDIAADFDDSTSTRRRSMQVSIPDPAMGLALRIQSSITGVTFSETVRRVVDPYLDATMEVLEELGYLNDFGNISTSLDSIKANIQDDRIEILRKFIVKCKSRGLDVSWICTSEL